MKVGGAERDEKNHSYKSTIKNGFLFFPFFICFFGFCVFLFGLGVLHFLFAFGGLLVKVHCFIYRECTDFLFGFPKGESRSKCR